jgi:hypothetical protein
MEKTDDTSDVVLFAPTNDLSETLAPITFEKNQESYGVFLPKETRVGKKIIPYGDAQGLLVKTGLIRSEQYRSQKIYIVSPVNVANYCRHLAYYDQEYMVNLAIYREKLVAIHETGIGGRSSVSANFRDAAKVSLLCGADGFYTVHNHPDGTLKPSAADKRTYIKWKNQAACVGIDLLGSVIITSEGWVSLSPVSSRKGKYTKGRRWTSRTSVHYWEGGSSVMEEFDDSPGEES